MNPLDLTKNTLIVSPAGRPMWEQQRRIFDTLAKNQPRLIEWVDTAFRHIDDVMVQHPGIDRDNLVVVQTSDLKDLEKSLEIYRAHLKDQRGRPPMTFVLDEIEHLGIEFDADRTESVADAIKRTIRKMLNEIDENTNIIATMHASSLAAPIERPLEEWVNSYGDL